jgi:(1->4)-alpha-D-glucan 1-alpha-D-glucosylmutase
LEAEEMMPSYWPIQGTSGYEFLSCINHLYTKSDNKDKLTSLYNQFIGEEKQYDELTFEKKFFILSSKMNGELENLLELLILIDPEQKEFRSQLKEALSVFLASFSIYRTYVDALPMREEDRVMLDRSFSHAENRRPDLLTPFQFLRTVLLFDANDPNKDDKLKLLVRFQQFTGPLAAKGVEDTVFYIYNRLISHNEVGDCPNRFGISVAEFHQSMKQRMQNLPLSINATSTHDTKRGEDARMRINVLSEIPDAWATVVMKWKAMNAGYKQHTSDGEIPEANDEYFIYQSLLGGFPSEGALTDIFLQRFKDFTVKAIREARIHTDWAKPNNHYEEKTISFVESILKDEEFMASFIPFYQIVKHYGMIL